LAIKFRITIEESFGIIQKLLVPEFGDKIGVFTPPAGLPADPDKAVRPPPPSLPRARSVALMAADI
jgi:hypothetical protein